MIMIERIGINEKACNFKASKVLREIIRNIIEQDESCVRIDSNHHNNMFEFCRLSFDAADRNAKQNLIIQQI
jgi:hypothetical protein